MSRRGDHEPTWRVLQVYFYKRKYQNCSEWPNSYVEIIPPNVMVLGGGVLHLHPYRVQTCTPCIGRTES